MNALKILFFTLLGALVLTGAYYATRQKTVPTSSAPPPTPPAPALDPNTGLLAALAVLTINQQTAEPQVVWAYRNDFTETLSPGQLPTGFLASTGSVWNQQNGRLSQTGHSTVETPFQAFIGAQGPVSLANASHIKALMRVDSVTGNGSYAGVGLNASPANDSAFALVLGQIGGAKHLSLEHADVVSGPRTPFIWEVGVSYWLQLERLPSGDVRGKVWPDGQAEPATWPLTWNQPGAPANVGGYPALIGGYAATPQESIQASFDAVYVA